MADSEREERERRRAAVEREMSRLRAVDEGDERDEPDDSDETRDQDLLDTVSKERRRERGAQDDDEAS
jgi:hypothetical protein